jgi:hypothetical protein
LKSQQHRAPARRELANVLHESQAKEHKRWAQEIEEFRKLSKKEQKDSAPPVKERGYFCTNLTLEGIRDDLDGHPTGGLVVIQDELSAFIGGQNEYKQRGTDRESWLTLWDAKMNSFLETSLASLAKLKPITQQCSTERDIENPKSRKSRPLNESEHVSETCETLKEQSLGPQGDSEPCSVDLRDKGDLFPIEEEMLI